MTVRAFAPGRVNLIGEHTDYNDGLCLPFAIGAGVTVTVEARDGELLAARALDLGEEDAFAVAAPPPASGWRAFVRGTAAELARAGYRPPGGTLTITGDVPRGGGLSSSAALGVALALALVAHAGAPEPERRELARLCSRVENDWVGARSGLLDQLAALYGHPGHAVRLDLRSLAVTPVPLRLGGWRLVTVDSGVAHAHAGSGYNERRAECEAACRLLGVRSLREVGAADAARLPEPLDRRARHVVEENERAERAVAALGRDDLPALGRLLDASHASLRDLYEVSVPAVEDTVARLKDAGAPPGRGSWAAASAARSWRSWNPAPRRRPARARSRQGRRPVCWRSSRDACRHAPGGPPRPGDRHVPPPAAACAGRRLGAAGGRGPRAGRRRPARERAARGREPGHARPRGRDQAQRRPGDEHRHDPRQVPARGARRTLLSWTSSRARSWPCAPVTASASRSSS